MKLLPNWRSVLSHAWSVRLMVLAGVLSGAEVAMPYLEGLIDLPTGVFAALSGFVTAGALLARIVAQKGVSTDG